MTYIIPRHAIWYIVFLKKTYNNPIGAHYAGPEVTKFHFTNAQYIMIRTRELRLENG